MVWPKGFDPETLTRDASLNKLVIGSGPGSRPAHVGQSGGDLLGRDAVVQLVKQRCGVDVRSDAVADWLGAAMVADPAGGAAAVVDEVANRLASLIATLRHPATAAAATGGRRTYLEVWQGLDEVVLGGGLMKGVVGHRAAIRLGAVLAKSGVDAPVVRVARHPEWLALLGAARSASDHDARVVVLDGGQSSIKRGIALVHDQHLVSVRVFPPMPITSVAATGISAVVARAVTALTEQYPGTAPEAIFSVASYLRNGRPMRDSTSIYEQLDPAVLRSEFGVQVRLMHDGSAAWRGTDAHTRSAVIVLGTWLGVGIGPHREPLRPCSTGFTIASTAPADAPDVRP